MVVGYSVLALVLLMRVHGPPWVYGNFLRLDCRGPVLWWCKVVLDRVVAVVRVCRLGVAPWHW